MKDEINKTIEISIPYKGWMSYLKHIGVGFIISLIIIITMRCARIYKVLPDNTTMLLATFSIVIIPISAGIWLFKDIKRIFKENKEV